MAHEIDTTVNANGAAIYANNPAWHGLGVTLDHAFTSAEALAVAGLDFTVEKQPLFTNLVNQPGLQKLEEHVATVRTDTGAVLGVVGPDYVPIQNRDSFRAFDAILAKYGAGYEAAAALRGGKRVFILAKLPTALQITNAAGDAIEEYFLLFNAHDGSGAIWLLPTPTRVVCANTLASALGKNFSIARRELAKGRALKVRHTGNAEERLLAANDVFEKAHQRNLVAVENAKRLAEVKATDELVEKTVQLSLNTFVGADIVISEDSIKAYEQRREKRDKASRIILDNIEAEYALVGKSGWAIYNGATEYADHDLTYRGKNAAENRFAAITTGRVDDYKTELVNLLAPTASIIAA